MAVFSKGLGLKNDVFLLEAIFDPSNCLKNIIKHLETFGISQNTFQDTKITKIGLLDPIFHAPKPAKVA